MRRQLIGRKFRTIGARNHRPGWDTTRQPFFRLSFLDRSILHCLSATLAVYIGMAKRILLKLTGVQLEQATRNLRSPYPIVRADLRSVLGDRCEYQVTTWYTETGISFETETALSTKDGK